jgi:uncharacterized protein Usg
MQFEEFQMMDYTLTAAKVLFRPPESPENVRASTTVVS